MVAESEERRVGLLAEELQLGGVLERAEVILFTQLKKNGKNEAGANLVSSYSTPKLTQQISFIVDIMLVTAQAAQLSIHFLLKKILEGPD